jgi:hypothetical protein
VPSRVRVAFAPARAGRRDAYAKACRRALPAAVIDPRTNKPEVVKHSPRVIPETAERIIVGPCIIGYRHKPMPPPKRCRIGALRKSEIERLILLRHGGSCDCDDGEVYFYIVANCLALPTLVANVSRPNPITLVYALLRKWAEKWVPRVASGKIDSVIARAIANPRRWRADTAAKLLRLTMAERTAANIKTIGATDCDKAARAERRKQRKRDSQRARDEAKRRARGAKSRKEYIAKSVAALARANRISRSTYYRRAKAENTASNFVRQVACTA